MSLAGIGALERGYRRTPQRETLALLAGALALSDRQRQIFEAAAVRPSLPRQRGTPVTYGPWPSAENRGLPFALTTFVGRKAELDEIAALARAHRLVTITGAGGIGKTQMALHVAGAGDAAVSFVGLAPVGDPALVPAAIAAAIGVQEVPNRPILETLLANLRGKRMLLILDNCEHVIREAAVVAEALLRGCPDVRILATSREPLGTAGERGYRLQSLIVDDAVTLFTDRAQAAEVHFRLTDDNAPIVANICQRLDGIPLAIELAAARVNVLPVQKLAERLDDRFRLLSGGTRTALPRQQAMRATIDWSYEALSVPEQRLFERLSIFAGGGTLETVAIVCINDDVDEASVLDLISSLVDKSLVVAEFSASEPRYGQLESFREYAREKLRARGEESAVAHRHALAFLEIAQTLAAATECEPRPSWEPRVREESENWRAALRWTLTSRGDVLTGQRLIGELVNATFFTFGEGQRWLDAATEVVDRKTPKSVTATLALAQAELARNYMNYKATLASSDKALVEYRSLGDSLGVARAQSDKANALFFLGDRERAQALHVEALELARGLRARRSVADILRMLGLASGSDVGAARRYLGEALQILGELGDQPNTACALIDLATCEFLAGKVDLALARATDALAAALNIGHSQTHCQALSDMAVYLIALDRWGEAAERARESLQLAAANDWNVKAMWSVHHLAAIAVLRPRIEAGDRPGVLQRAARLLGCYEARLAALGSAQEPVHRKERERALEVLNDVIGPEAIAAFLAEGATMTAEQAVEEALEL